MNDDIDGWIYFDAPEPEFIRPLLDALRDLPPATSSDKERITQSFFKKLDEAISKRDGASGDAKSGAQGSLTAEGAPIRGDVSCSAQDSNRLVSQEGPTARSPSFDDSNNAGPPAAQEARRSTMDVLSPRPSESLKERPSRASPHPPTAHIDTTMVVPILRIEDVDTSHLGDGSLKKAMTALPFVATTAGMEIVSFPRLTIEQYASFQVELFLWPERSAEIHSRYHIPTKAAGAALDEHWKNHLEQDSEERVRFDKAFIAYRAWIGRASGV